ncbi:helix-turn-helix domain-containing protein [Halobellus limi]|uniref:Bacterio-opsin activator n=1 Tax=Halobellus limi TaxID=699433 RepID=A0A1H5X6A4_9EURY|nr:helix-turn-helix domain-containing protein [Halobellus limi]QCC46238.1 bacterio-opsin activator [Halobellus limi]SEG07251.1 GAF and HTH_10 associated domain-containing protein [Halobellus limi]
MGFIAEYTIDSPVMEETHDRVPEAVLEMEDLQILQDGQAKYVFWVSNVDPETFEAALSDDPSVAEFAVLTSIGDRSLYRVNFTSEARRKMTYPEASNFDIVFLGAHSTNEGVHFRSQVPTRDALYSFRERCRELGIPFKLDSIYQEGNSDALDQYGLTDAQREALVLAHERGYFEPTRKASLEEIASDLSISRQALAGRLRRGHAQLIESTLL